MKPAKTALINLSRSWIRVEGPDASRLLNGMWTADLKRAALFVNEHPVVAEALLLDTKGKPVSPAVILCLSTDRYLLSVPRSEGQAVYDALDRYLAADDVQLTLEMNEFLLARSLPEGFPNSGAVKKSQVEPPVPDALDRLYFAETHPWGWTLPRGHFGDHDVECWVKPGQTWPFEFEVLSERDILERRVERGLPEWRVDYGPESLVLEFPFAQAISFHKGCYIGQEVVARGTYRGKINRAFSRLSFREMAQTDFVYSEVDASRPVGKITSAFENRGLGLLRLSAATEPLYQNKEPARNTVEKVESLR